MRKIKKGIVWLIIVCLLMVENMVFMAETVETRTNDLTTGSCGQNLVWEIDENGVLTISGTGEMYDYLHHSGWDEWNPELVKEVIVKQGVTNIGGGAFEDCVNLVKVSLQGRIKSIDYYAFQGCINLETIETGTALLRIGKAAFSGCTNLKKITWPNCVEKIEYSAFSDCINLEVTDFPDSLKVIEDYAFKNCDKLDVVNLPEGCESVGNNAFSWCTNLVELKLPNSITDVGREVCYDCENLERVSLSESMWCIPTAGFLNCVKLKEVIIPESVESIGEEAFYGCKELNSVIFSTNIEKIGNSAFSGCSNLRNINLPEKLRSIGYWAFSGTGVKDIEIPATVSYIGNEAFRECDELVKIVWPIKVTKIGKYMFHGCDSLEIVEIPESMVIIDEYAFGLCNKLENVSLPSGIETINKNAFYECSNLKNINIPSSVKSMGMDIFYGCNDLLICCAPESEAYYYAIDYGIDYAFDMHALDIEINLSRDKYTYDGTEKKPGVEVKIGESTLVESEDYAVSYKNNVETGFATVVVEGIGEYKGKFEKTYEILPETLINATVNLNKENFVYDGTEKKPLVSVQIGERTLIENVDYTILYENNINVGTAKVIVTGIGNYEGVIELNYVIEPMPVVLMGKISFNIEEKEAEPGECFQINTVLEPINVSNNELIWSSSNESVATVDENGKVTAVGEGTAIITATAADGSGVSATCEVTVLRVCKHTNKTFIEAKVANCIEGGWSAYYTCDECDKILASDGSTELSVIPQTAEDSSNHTNIKSYGADPATCMHQGHGAYKKCLDCETIIEGSDELFSGDHNYGELIPAVAEKHTSSELTPAVSEHYKCSYCSKYFTKDKEETTLAELTGPTPSHSFTDEDDISCNECDYVKYTPGNIDDDTEITDRDAVHLLYHTFLPDLYPVNQDCDFNGDGEVNDKDAVYLLYHTFLPDLYPINK